MADTTATDTYDYVIYQLEDGGSVYPGLLLRPGKPVPADRHNQTLIERLLEDGVIARCDSEGNLAQAQSAESTPDGTPEVSTDSDKKSRRVKGDAPVADTAPEQAAPEQPTPEAAGGSSVPEG